MAETGVAARRMAADLLGHVLNDGYLLSEALGQRSFAGLAAQDRARAQRLATETLRSMERVDRILKPFLRKTPPNAVRNVLRVSCYELCAGGAAHGVVNDAVTILSKSKRTAPLKGLANAVLRKVAATGPEEWEKLRVPRLPKWLRSPLVEAYDAKSVAAMEAAHFAGAPVDVSVKSDAETWAKTLEGTVLPSGSVRLSAPGQISSLPGFEAGDWWVQDAAAAMPAKILNVQLGETVADLCCAPGGKTMQLAATGAQVQAFDISEKRMARVSENLKRCGLKAQVQVMDALQVSDRFDAILLDAPCSATGTLRRHPDLPLVKDGAEFGALIDLQSQMLNHAADLLKPGGRLMFCTCSLLPDEGECQIDEIMATRDDLVVDQSIHELEWVEQSWITPEGGLRLRPDFWAESGGMDGFYMALLRKPT